MNIWPHSYNFIIESDPLEDKKMNNDNCVQFLQEYLPKLGYRWKGFRKVRKQVCKRIRHRLRELNLSDISSYHQYLESHREEAEVLDFLCNITISRFYRDRGIFERLETEILPSLAESAVQNNLKQVRCWSAGCCSGEEPYTLQILWKLSVSPGLSRNIPLQVIATDRDPSLTERAKKGIYPAGSFKDMPVEWKDQAFDFRGNNSHIKEIYKQDVRFQEQDIRKDLPDGEFELILCRNLVFTYFQENLQRETFNRIMTKLKPGGFFIVGIHESIPAGQNILIPSGKCIYKKRDIH
jgi:chemotaxis protein methyltransferase CheR